MPYPSGPLQNAAKFNTLANDLASLNAFISDVNSGLTNLFTDGSGNYWCQAKLYNAVTGAAITITIDLNVSELSSAQASLSSLATLMQNATVGIHP